MTTEYLNDESTYYTDHEMAHLLGISLGRLRNKLTAGNPLPPRIQPPGCRTRASNTTQTTQESRQAHQKGNTGPPRMSIAAMNWVWRQQLPPTPKLVLMSLSDSADDHSVCWPSVPTVARKCCVSIRTARRIMRELEASGRMKRDPRFRKDGSRTSNRYILALDLWHAAHPQRFIGAQP